jgi:hypothetical protein
MRGCMKLCVLQACYILDYHICRNNLLFHIVFHWLDIPQHCMGYHLVFITFEDSLYCCWWLLIDRWNFCKKSSELENNLTILHNSDSHITWQNNLTLLSIYILLDTSFIISTRALRMLYYVCILHHNPVYEQWQTSAVKNASIFDKKWMVCWYPYSNSHWTHKFLPIQTYFMGKSMERYNSAT